MHCIPHTLTVTNPHKRLRTDLEDPSGGKRGKAEPVPVQPGSNFKLWDSFNPMRHRSEQQVTDLTEHLMEWLCEEDTLQLMLTGKHPRQTVALFYLSRMKPTLKVQPCLTVLSHPYKHNPSAKWVIDQTTLRKQSTSPTGGTEPVVNYTANLRPHSCEDEDQADNSFRAPFSPRWQIEKIKNIPVTDPETGAQVEVYRATLTATGDHADHPVFLYRTPMNRPDRYIPTDQRGLRYLAARKIFYPLTEKIKNEHGMTVAKAEKYIAEQRQLIGSALASQALSSIQKGALRSPLFAEHLECGRLDLAKALKLAEDEMTLFYCLTLLPLFRKGIIELSDLSVMSKSAIRLLHDPRLVELVYAGVINKPQLMTLTTAQYWSISILADPLQKCLESSKSVLALSSGQIIELRKAGFLEDVAFGQIALSKALLQVKRKAETTLSSGQRFGGLPASSSSSSSSLFPARESISALPSGSGITSPPRAKSQKADTIRLSEVELLVSLWPASEIRGALYAATEELDIEWLDALQRSSRHIAELQKIMPATKQEQDNPFLSEYEAAPVYRSVRPDSDAFRSSSSSSSLSLIAPRSTDFSASSLQSISGDRNEETRSTEEFNVQLKDIATLMSRMSPETLNDVISAGQYGGNADWVAAFGKIVHLMPLKKILDFFSASVLHNGEIVSVFESLEDGISSHEAQEVAYEFNQIVVELAQQLNAKDYLQVAGVFLRDVFGFMMAWSYKYSCSNIFDQCGEIWSLVQSRCAMTGESVRKYADMALVSLKDASWGDGFISLGTGQTGGMHSFGCCLVNMGLLENEEFLKLWTDNYFDEDPDFNTCYPEVLDHIDYQGIVACHALFRRFLRFEYGARAHRFMDAAVEQHSKSPHL